MKFVIKYLGVLTYWQIWEPGRKPVNFPLMPWHEAIHQPGAGQIQYGHWLIESRPFLTRIPDDSVIVPHDVSNAVTGAGGTGLLPPVIKDGTYAMAYVPTGRSFKVRMDVIQGAKAIAWWYIPRTGEAEKIGVYPTEDIRSFTPPTPGEHLG